MSRGIDHDGHGRESRSNTSCVEQGTIPALRTEPCSGAVDAGLLIDSVALEREALGTNSFAQLQNLFGEGARFSIKSNQKAGQRSVGVVSVRAGDGSSVSLRHMLQVCTVQGSARGLLPQVVQDKLTTVDGHVVGAPPVKEGNTCGQGWGPLACGHLRAQLPSEAICQKFSVRKLQARSEARAPSTAFLLSKPAGDLFSALEHGGAVV